MEGNDESSKDSPGTSRGDGSSGSHGPNKAPRHVPSTSKESPVVARRKITRPPRLESVSESEVSSNVESPSSSSEWGVRSYLHNFYEPERGMRSKDDLFLGADHQSSMKDSRHDSCSTQCWRRRCACAAHWWKAGVFVGVNILILAVLALLIGYLVKPRQDIVDYRADVAVVDQEDAAFNRKLEAAKLAGLIMLCVGGFIVAVSLLIPSVLTSASESAGHPSGINIDPDDNFPPYLPLKTTDDPMAEDGIPYTSELSNVQPQRSGTESVVAGKGMIKVQAS
ncbi:uncharacterized protein LOC121430457 [Lytechinus variegatus]|uniref:uncharacterized protein LOC121430457 n=1 Tax=Lytechinus variegatus TaxID=7654 RepID=UPI001BB0FAFE|nr:uncharacterized protein LOC121430457 [Lytechinus variegatus]